MKTTLQFKLSFMFFMVMLISATVSVSLLLLIFSPIMKKNAETQLTEVASSASALSEVMKDKNVDGTYDAAKIISMVTNSGFTVELLREDSNEVGENLRDIDEKGYHIETSGIIPKATMVIKVYDSYYHIDNFSNDSLYWIVNFVIILALVVMKIQYLMIMEK